MFESSTNKMRFREAFDNYFDAVTRYCLRRLPQSNANDAAANSTRFRRGGGEPGNGAADEAAGDEKGVSG